MLNLTQSEIKVIASEASWDSFTLLLLISRWLDEKNLANDLIDHLAGVAMAEE